MGDLLCDTGILYSIIIGIQRGAIDTCRSTRARFTARISNLLSGMLSLGRLHSRPGLIQSNFSTTHFPRPFHSLINMPEGFSSKKVTV